MKKEIRVNQIQEFRAEEVEDKLQFRGYAAVFNELSEDLGGFRERISPGAFGESVLQDDVRALFNHDPNYVIGRNKSGTLRLLEDEKGLYFEAEAPDTQWARDLKASVDRGDINQCSFGFIAKEDDWQMEGGADTRTLQRCQLFDVSIVTYPAYTGTNVRSASEVYQQVKSERDEAVKQEQQDIKLKLELYGRL